MKKIIKNSLIILIITAFWTISANADDYTKAEKLIRKSQTASFDEESYEYLNNAREIYLKKYNENQGDIRALLGLSKVNQYTGDRREAKLYLLKAYNTNPADPKLQREMADFFFNFQEYSTAIEYYKSSLASGLLMDFDTNLKTAKCFEKLGDLKNAELYYQICNHLNSKSKQVKNKLNEYTSEKHPDNTQELESARYKYLFKDKPLSEGEKTEEEAENIIKQMNGDY